MNEVLFDFLIALAGMFLFFSAMGVGCAIWEITVEKRRKRKQLEKRKRDLYFCFYKE